MVSAFVLAAVGAAGAQFYGFLSDRIFTAASNAPGPSPTLLVNSPTALLSPSGSVAGSVPPASPPVATEVRIFRPFVGGSLRSTYHVSRTATGDCTVSRTSRDPAALHCFSDTATEGGAPIYDPCWPSQADDGLVGCIDDPWTTAAVLLQLTSDPSVEKNTTPRPWAFQLVPSAGESSGIRCIAVFGHRDVVAGQDVNYRCVLDGVMVGDALGDPMTSGSGPWRIWYSPLSAVDASIRTIAVVWN